MNTLTWIFIIALCISAALRSWLAGRQIRHVRRKRIRVPDAFVGGIELAAHQKAADYTVSKTRFSLLGLALDLALALLWTLGEVSRCWMRSGARRTSICSIPGCW